ncbi:MAG TPA: septum formation initiator family protein, partial [Dehalococcoidia bacterium]|nr:septum formation initiator family protein [Dehalococcoidia bacterium]
MRAVLRVLGPSRLLLALAGLAFIYLVFTGVQHTLRLGELLRQEDEVKTETVALEWDMERLQALREYFNSDEYIEGQARRILGWARPGEKGIIVTGPPRTEAQEIPRETPIPGSRWWEAFFQD